jgi:MFS family permease
MTTGRGSFGMTNTALLLACILGGGLFLRVEARASSPLIRFTMFRDPVLGASLVMSSLVATVMMATLIVGPFYLSRALGLEAAGVGLVMSAGPLVAALFGVPAGYLVDRFKPRRITIAGLIGMASGLAALALAPSGFGVAGYIAAIIVVTANYALFQAANNTTVMTDVRSDQRGAVSGMLNLSRNLGLITGASVMGAVFAFASAATDASTASPEAVAAGMQTTFGFSVFLVLAALTIALRWRAAAPGLHLQNEQ